MDLERLLTPRSDDHLATGRRIWTSRPDLQAAFPDGSGLSFWQWLGCHGLREYPAELARFYPPVPPHELRCTASCGATAADHLQSGMPDLQILGELWETFTERPFEQLPSVLDFGCGCGRLLRWFQTALPGTRALGTDVRAASIAWCQQHLAGTFLANGIAPPLAVPDASVDLVVALSVFSHLNLRSQRQWMRELARITRPDGLLLVTTHGAFALALLNRSAEHRAVLGIDAATARGYQRRLEREHFLFHPLPGGEVEVLDGVEADYGHVFFDAAFVREQFGDCVQLLGSVPASLQLWQDFFVLRPRLPSAG